MEKPEFSERRFEFCFNYEFVRRYMDRFSMSPYIPNQTEEGRKGYDVKFPTSPLFCQTIFIQHKIAKYFESPPTVGRRPAFNFSINRKQHYCLCRLRNIQPNVYYCAPLFYSEADLDNCFSRCNILSNSVFIDPYGTYIRDNHRHSIYYSSSSLHRRTTDSLVQARRASGFLSNITSGSLDAIVHSEVQKAKIEYASKAISRIMTRRRKGFEYMAEPTKFCKFP